MTIANCGLQIMMQTQIQPLAALHAVYRQFYELDHAIEVCKGLESQFDPWRVLTSVGMTVGSRRMCQTFARYDGLAQPDVEFVIVVEMRERFTAVTQGRKTVVAAGQRSVFNAQLCNSFDQLFA
jgi:hypothetical protein